MSSKNRAPLGQDRKSIPVGEAHKIKVGEAHKTKVGNPHDQSGRATRPSTSASREL
jgi:hypothetical protein